MNGWAVEAEWGIGWTKKRMVCQQKMTPTAPGVGNSIIHVTSWANHCSIGSKISAVEKTKVSDETPKSYGVY